ncbi:MAG: 4Fe-4S dicluster domain-containing protein [Thermoleophilia bacterium]|nr:4Fe-4S dicluster domain-containing protein [Thermoleophilia bacterium]
MADQAARRTWSVHRFRRLFQIVFFLLFLALLTLTVWPLGTLLLSGFLLADPLLAINSVANGVLRWEFLLAVPVLLSPLFVGRAFCGYVCPMGFLVELLGPRRERRPRPRAHGVLRQVPLFGLLVVAILILFGSAVFLVFDPLSLLTRSATTLVYPAVDRGLRLAGDVLYLAPPLRGGVDSVTEVLTGRLVFTNGLAYKLQLVMLFMFVAILALSWFERRLWCRHLCPLGALLGLIGRAAIFSRVIDEQACTRCGACTAVCSMDAVGDDGVSTDCSRCQGGLECIDTCPNGAIRWGRRPRKQHEYDPSRRALLKAGGLAFVGGFFLFSGLGRVQRNAHLIRPPGARSELDFMATCARCGACMKVCPTNVIQPAVFDAGLEGFFTPQMDFRRAYCDWNCNECGKVCPTQAIRELSLQEKRLKIIGRAYIDRNTCIPWAEGRDCLVCQELCPIPEKAIVFDTGDDAGVKLPRVVPERCIGCGICQYNCPVANEAAIRVRSTAQTGLLSR